MKLIFLATTAAFAIFGTGSLPAEPPIQPGDRIAIVGNTFADQLRIHGYLETLLLQISKDDPISIRNLGWGGDMMDARDRPTGFPTEQSTLTAHRTDVIIACFGMGESFAGEKGLETFKSDITTFIASHRGKKYNGESEVRLVLVSPIACEDLGELTPNRERRNKELESYTRGMGEVASAAKVPFVNLFDPSLYLMDERAGPDLTSNGIHLKPFGYWALSRTFFSQLIKDHSAASDRTWRLNIDAKAKSGEARGVEISNVVGDTTKISFQVAEVVFPNLPPPTGDTLPPQLADQRDTLFVKGLEAGTYQLTIGGEQVATADAQTWAMGVAIDASPTHQAAETYRANVNDKNLQFTYSWKALNQVHIVGERRKSPSGRALPEEVIAFNKLADERDEKLAAGIELKTRQWTLSRTKP